MKFIKSLGWFNLKTFLIFAGSNVFLQLVTFVSELFVLGMVCVDMIGTWQYALLIQSYVIASRLGIINSFNREYPFLISSKNQDKAEAVLRATAFHTRMSMIAQALVFLFLLCYQFWIGAPSHMILVLGVMIGYTMLSAMANFEEAKQRAKLNFNRISKANIVVAFLSFGALIFPYYMDFPGLLIRVLLIQVVLVSFYKMLDNDRVEIKWSKSVWLELFREGWKLWIWSNIKNFNKSLPKLFLVTFSTITVLGLYTPVNWMLMSFSLFTAALTAYIYPNLSQRYAKNDQNLPQQALTISLVSYVISVPFLIIGVFLIPWLILTCLPQYEEVIFPMQIVIIASSFDVFSVASTVWVSMKDWRRMFIFVFGSLIIRLMSLLWLYRNQEEILLNMSYSLLFTSIAVFILVLVMVAMQNEVPKKKTAVLSL